MQPIPIKILDMKFPTFKGRLINITSPKYF